MSTFSFSVPQVEKRVERFVEVAGEAAKTKEHIEWDRDLKAETGRHRTGGQQTGCSNRTDEPWSGFNCANLTCQMKCCLAFFQFSSSLFESPSSSFSSATGQDGPAPSTSIRIHIALFTCLRRHLHNESVVFSRSVGACRALEKITQRPRQRWRQQPASSPSAIFLSPDRPPPSRLVRTKSD